LTSRSSEGDSLRVRQLRLEGADTTDRTFAVARLNAVTADGTAAAADALFSKLDYLTVATGRDYTDVAPTSGTYLGTARGNLTATKQVYVALP
jgi:transglutaminase-like putative cysteine protease